MKGLKITSSHITIKGTNTRQHPYTSENRAYACREIIEAVKIAAIVAFALAFVWWLVHHV